MRKFCFVTLIKPFAGIAGARNENPDSELVPPLDGMDVWNTISHGQPSPRKEILHNIDLPNDDIDDLNKGREGVALRVGDMKLLMSVENMTWYKPPELGASFAVDENEVNFRVRSALEYIDLGRLFKMSPSNLSVLAGPTSQFLNRMHEFSELVLARIALLMNLRAARFFHSGRRKCRNLESCGWKNVLACVFDLFLLNWPESIFFGRSDRANGQRPS